VHNEELRDLSSPSIIQVVNLRRMSWAGHLAQKFILGFGGEIWRKETAWKT